MKKHLLNTFIILCISTVVVLLAHGNMSKSTIGFLQVTQTIDVDGPMTFDGTYTSSAIDFTGSTIDHTGSGGPTLIRAGTYGSPISNSDEDQSGMIRLYQTTDADGNSYDRTVFAHARTTGEKGVFPVAGLAEIGDSGSSDGPEQIMGGQFIVDMLVSGSKFDSGSFGMFGVWAKVGGATGSVLEAGTQTAAIWVDNQHSGTVSGEEYGIFATTGASVPDAFIGFQTTSSGWQYLFSFDETMAGVAPISTVTPATSGQDATGSLIIQINGTDYYIPFYTLAQD